MQSISNKTGHNLFTTTTDQKKLNLINSLGIFDYSSRYTDVNFLKGHLENMDAHGDIKILQRSNVEQPWNGWFSSIKNQFKKLSKTVNKNPLNNFSTRATLDVDNGDKNCDIMFKQISDLLDNVVSLEPSDQITIIYCTVTEKGLLNVSAIYINGKQFGIKAKMMMTIRGYIIEKKNQPNVFDDSAPIPEP